MATGRKRKQASQRKKTPEKSARTTSESTPEDAAEGASIRVQHSRQEFAPSPASPHVTERHTYTGFSRTEQVTGLFWLSLGALVSVLLEVVYLGTWIGGVPVPYTIVIAFLFNMVLTKTGLLWSKNKAVALIPAYVWTAGYLILLMAESITGDQLLGNSLRSIALLIAGIIGASWPLMHRR